MLMSLALAKVITAVGAMLVCFPVYWRRAMITLAVVMLTMLTTGTYARWSVCIDRGA